MIRFLFGTPYRFNLSTNITIIIVFMLTTYTGGGDVFMSFIRGLLGWCLGMVVLIAGTAVLHGRDA